MTTALSDLSPAERTRAITDNFLRIADTVTDWDAQSPVREWTARDVPAHFVGWVPGFFAAAGVTVAAPAPSGDDPAAAFRELATVVQALIDAPDAGREVTFPGLGTMPLSELIDRFYAADLFMHSWDLARSNGLDAELDPDFASALHTGLAAMGPMLRESGQFGTEQPVDPDADEVRKLIAFIGRDPAC
jgi:uncharacterized protein (TIGR03086 family)